MEEKLLVADRLTEDCLRPQRAYSQQYVDELKAKYGWHTGEPTVEDPLHIKEVFVLLFFHPIGGWFYRGHLFKPDFEKKCFRSCVDKNITFPFNSDNMRWQKIEPYEASE